MGWCMVTISWRRRRMRSYTARWEAKIGDGFGDDKELNRLIRYVPNGMEWKLEVEADARHAEILKAFGQRQDEGCGHARGEAGREGHGP